MGEMRDGDLWFSTVEEALAHARRSTPRVQALHPAYSSFIRVSALAVLGWGVLRTAVRSSPPAAPI